MILPSESSDIGGRKTTNSNMDLSQAHTQSMILPSGSSNLGGINTMDSNMVLCNAPPNQHSMVVSSPGSVAIFWDIENCPVPSDVRPEDIAGNIRMALLIHPVIKGAVNLFSAYGDFNAFPRRLREGCQRTGVKLVDVPNGRKDAADKAILVDMFLFALDNPPPSSILLISGDVDFSPALHILGQRGYTVILVAPSGVGVSSALVNAGRYVWDWQCVARGEGFLPPKTGLPRGEGFLPPKTGLPRGSSEMSGYYMGCHIRDNMDGHIEEEAIIYRGISQNQHTTQTNLNQICYINSRDSSRVSQSLSEFRSNSLEKPSFPGSSSQNLPSGYKVSDCRYESLDETLFVQPGDINGLKGQLVKLLELSGGRLPLVRISMEYQKIFRKPLFVADYGVFKLVDLLNNMTDTVTVEGKGNQRFVSLKQSINKPDKVGPSSPFDQGRKDKKGKGTAEKNVGPNRVFSSDEFSDDDRTAGAALNSTCELYYRLREFKQELQELFVSCSHHILLSSFEGLYKQRYKKAPNYISFGVQELEELIDKVGDVAVLYEEQDSKRKFLIPNCLSS